MRRLTALLKGLAGFVALAILTVLLVSLFSRASGSQQRPNQAAGVAAAIETATQPAFQSPVQTPIGPTAQMPTPTQTPADRTFQSPVQTPVPSLAPWPTPTPTPELGLLELVRDAAISPDGHQVLFVSQQSTGEKEDVFALSLDSDQVRPFLQRGGEIRPKRVDWSPDGRTVAMATWTDPWTEVGSYHDIYLADAQGSGLLNLTASLDEIIQEFAWSPDSQSIACITVPKDSMNPDNLWVCRVNTQECVRFAVRAFMLSGGGMGYLAWAPDSSKLAVGYEMQIAVGRLALVDLAAGTTGLLPQPADYGPPDPLWFPDGSRIAFFATRLERLAEPDFWIMTAQGQELHKVAELRYPEAAFRSVSLPQWLSDDRIAFYWEEAIWSMRADGSELERLTPREMTPSLLKAPSISRVGHRMAFVVREYPAGLLGQRISRIALLDLADKSLITK
jgi:Tol biopolymer transport system component